MAQALENERQPMEAGPAGEISLRIEAAGYGGVPVRAIVPIEALAGIERGELPIETNLEMKVPGYGWRVVGVRVFAGGEEGVPDRSVRLTVPGSGAAPLRMTFVGKEHSR